MFRPTRTSREFLAKLRFLGTRTDTSEEPRISEDHHCDHDDLMHHGPLKPALWTPLHRRRPTGRPPKERLVDRHHGPQSAPSTDGGRRRVLSTVSRTWFFLNSGSMCGKLWKNLRDQSESVQETIDGRMAGSRASAAYEAPLYTIEGGCWDP